MSIIAVGGCAMGSYGPIAARYTTTATAVVMDVYAAGIDVRPAGPDAGASVGFRHASYIFVRRNPCDRSAVGTVWRWFHAPWPETRPIVQGVTALGVEAQFARLVRFVAGYVDHIVTIGPRADESMVVNLFYDRFAPHRTYLRISQEDNHGSWTTC